MPNMFGLNTYDYDKIDSLTKYPSILTYHNLGARGGLAEGLVEEMSFDGHEVLIYEKVDGTNARIIFVTDENGIPIDYILGSRRELLYANGDRIMNPALHLAESMSFYANWLLHIPGIILKPNHVYVLYGELYGGELPARKNYTSHGEYGVRFFDAWTMSLEDFEFFCNYDSLRIAAWREHGGQPFMNIADFEKLLLTISAEDETYSGDMSNIIFKRVPCVKIIDGSKIPTDLKSTYEFLKEFENSKATLDGEALAKSEGVVVRTADRKRIRKLRFEDYRKTERQGLL